MPWQNHPSYFITKDVFGLCCLDNIFEVFVNGATELPKMFCITLWDCFEELEDLRHGRETEIIYREEEEN